MDIGNKAALRQDIAFIQSRLGLTIDPVLKHTYLHGGSVPLAYYEKIADEAPLAPAVTRMLLVAESEVAQPDVTLFYDIFRVARYATLTQILADALKVVSARTSGYEPRVARLASAQDFDDLEAVIFELVVAARYAIHPGVTSVGFIPETTTPTPDLRVCLLGREVFVECKKFDRMTDAAPRIRDAVRDATNGVVQDLKDSKTSAVVEWKIDSDAQSLDGEELRSDVLECLRGGGAVVRPGSTVVARRVVPLDLRRSFQLVPSPGYYWSQFEFLSAGPWQGIVDAFRARMAGPSFVDELSWVCAVKWAVVNEEALWRRKRLGYSLIFKGLDQLEASGGDCILHVCYERAGALGPRQAELRRFVETMGDRRQNVGWIVFNELDIDVTRGGNLDFREHAHFLAGGRQFGAEPPVTMVFVPGEGVHAAFERFGIGADLPPLD